MANRADVVLADRVDRLYQPADGANSVYSQP